MTAKVIAAIETELERRGTGKDLTSPIRIIKQFWTLDGKLLAEIDPITQPLPDAVKDLVAAVEHVRSIISEASATGFNCHDGDWAERLFASQGWTCKALNAVNASSTSKGTEP